MRSSGIRLLISLAFVSVAAIAAQQQQQTEDDTSNRPPRLKRGIPKPTDARAEASPEQKPVSPPPAVREIVTDADGNVISERGAPGPAGTLTATSAAAPVDDVIDKARVTTAEFVSRIPDFLCDEIVFRHEGEGWPRPTWKLKDRITAELMFIDGRESLRNVKVSSKIPLIGRNKDPEKTGQWSSGDWVSIISDALQPSSDARFTPDGEEAIGGRAAKRYRYRVMQLNSHWRVGPDGSQIKPAYRGRMWIDKETFNLLRIEMEAVELPTTFPWSVVEMTTELGTVQIGGKSHLLPVKSENLTCRRDSVSCDRNELEFRNYRQFTAESTISTTDSSVKYEGAEEPPKAAPPPAAKGKAKTKR